MHVHGAEKAAYSINETIEISGLGRTSIYEEIRLGRLRAKKVGRRTLILHTDLVDWLQNLPCLNTGRPAPASDIGGAA